MMQILSRTLPRAEVSAGAIRANLTMIAQRMHGGHGDVLVDVSGDALGHGAELVSAIARERGFGGTFDGGVAATLDDDDDGGGGDRPRRCDDVALHMTLGLNGSSLRPAMRLIGEILGTKELRAGEGVSYGHTFVAPEETRVALVTGGYAQGLVRSLGNRLHVAIGEHRYPIIGRVAMDACVVDIGSAEIRRGDPVVFLGDPERGEPSIDEWITTTGMCPEELVFQIGLRARREVVA